MMNLVEIADLCDRVADDIREAAGSLREVNAGTIHELSSYEKLLVKAAVSLAAIENTLDIP